MLDHVARMEDHRLIKKILFSWLPQYCPAHGTKMKWHDRVRKDMKTFHIEEMTEVDGEYVAGLGCRLQPGIE